jgi:DNA-binding beta-propeller fold protein YncE
VDDEALPGAPKAVSGAGDMIGACCKVAPPVLVYDQAGSLVKSWGGPGQGYEWPDSNHGITVDHKGNVWLAGNGNKDTQVLKFTRDGKFLLQIGKHGVHNGSNDTQNFWQPTKIFHEPVANEVYISDGYGNRRVIVFDADTGAYKRHWGAYGRAPVDDKVESRRTVPPTQAQLQNFGTPVHCVRVARDGLVYVCDRLNNRVQVFHKDGSFVREFMVEPETTSNGSVWDIVLSRDPGQRWLLLADGRNNQIWTIDRATGAVAGSIGRPGRYAGEFHWIHDLAIDSRGDLYAGEVDTGKRVQKFVRR